MLALDFSVTQEQQQEQEESFILGVRMVWEALHSLGENVECMYHLFDEDTKCLCYDL